MDNICHSLVGLAMGEAGLKRRTSLGTATLIIGANLPDVDVLAYRWGPVTALGFRRGWTHGILAMAVWPLVLVGVMLALDRLVRRKREAGGPGTAPADARGLLLLAALSIWSHPLLDLLNTYGVRLLMPFSGTWFYGDTLFIVDPWVWLALLVGIVWSRRTQRSGSATPFRPARVAFAVVTGYIAIMFTIGLASRPAVRRAFAHEGFEVQSLMVAPEPLYPLRRQAVARVSDGYASAVVPWFRARVPSGVLVQRAGPIVYTMHSHLPVGDTLPEARAAAATPEGRTFLSWARFPYYVTDSTGQRCARGYVCISDLRYYPEAWAQVAVPVGGRISSSPSP